MRLFLSLIVLLSGVLGSYSAQAQSIRYNEDVVIAKMMQRFVDLNRSKDAVEGWRVQILATNDRQKLESARQSFKYRYPNIPVDWVHNRPWYQLRVGAFATKLEALRLKYVLNRDYTGIYPVKDDSIKPSEMINSAY